MTAADRGLNPIQMVDRGPLRQVAGTAVAANLPAHIPQRMVDRARASLGDLGVPVNILPQRVTAAGPGAGIFLVAEYENMAASFSGYGRLGKPSEAVADEAVAAFREHHASDAAVELHLADQLLLPLSLADGISTFTTPRPTGHLVTNAWSIGQFAIADISIERGHAMSREHPAATFALKAREFAISPVAAGGDGRDLHVSTAQSRRDRQPYRSR